MGVFTTTYEEGEKVMPAVTRIGDNDTSHCSTPTRAQGSTNVFVNGIPVSRQGDNNTPHLLPGSPAQHTRHRLLRDLQQCLSMAKVVVE